MPTYEYECPDCGEHFEAQQRMSDDPITECPNCGEHQVRRVLFAPAIHFKGKGFYNTDYGTRKRGGESDSGSKDGAGSDSGSGGEKAGATSGGDSSSSGGEKSSGKTVGLDKI